MPPAVPPWWMFNGDNFLVGGQPLTIPSPQERCLGKVAVGAINADHIFVEIWSCADGLLGNGNQLGLELTRLRQ